MDESLKSHALASAAAQTPATWPTPEPAPNATGTALLSHAIAAAVLILTGATAFWLQTATSSRTLQAAAWAVLAATAIGLLAIAALTRAERAQAANALLWAQALRRAAQELRAQTGPELYKKDVHVSLSRPWTVRRDIADKALTPTERVSSPLEHLASELGIRQAHQAVAHLAKTGQATEALNLSAAIAELESAIHAALSATHETPPDDSSQAAAQTTIASGRR